MAVARHAVNRTGVKPGDSVVVFGAGSIGLGATISYKLSGARSVVVVDVIPSRLERALAVGADAVINSAEEDVVARLTELHGTAATALGAPRPGTDIYLDAAGVPVAIDTALAAAKHGATVGIVAVHKKARASAGSVHHSCGTVSWRGHERRHHATAIVPGGRAVLASLSRV